jgi:multidrug efflux pump subunit AcrB
VVQVNGQLPGADAETITNTVGAPIEQQVNGVQDMLYMSSTSAKGSYSLTVTFAVGTDPISPRSTPRTASPRPWRSCRKRCRTWA